MRGREGGREGVRLIIDEAHQLSTCTHKLIQIAQRASDVASLFAKSGRKSKGADAIIETLQNYDTYKRVMAWHRNASKSRKLRRKNELLTGRLNVDKNDMSEEAKRQREILQKRKVGIRKKVLKELELEDEAFVEVTLDERFRREIVEPRELFQLPRETSHFLPSLQERVFVKAMNTFKNVSHGRGAGL